jgi:7-cyano-7-deazaguanine tRNA-ribosyltransferase
LLVVAGLSLKNLHPRVWDPGSPYYLPNLRAVMVSYADFHRMAPKRRAAMEQCLHAYLGLPEQTQVYLDNGAFYFLTRGGEVPTEEYERFVQKAKPDWYPIPRDYIPTPAMTHEDQKSCFAQTMRANIKYQHDGYTSVIHISPFLRKYLQKIEAHPKLSKKRHIALGGIVPNLLRAPKAIPYQHVLRALMQVRRTFADQEIHVFGIGGTATLHLAAILGIDSVDSSGWRNRAARGIVQLPGSGDRMMADLGSWRGRQLSPQEREMLTNCPCPACVHGGLEDLAAKRIEGFCNRAAHNLWVLLEEALWVEDHLTSGTYEDYYEARLDNSIYRRLIQNAVEVSDLTVGNNLEGRRKRRVTSGTNLSRKSEHDRG